MFVNNKLLIRSLRLYLDSSTYLRLRFNEAVDLCAISAEGTAAIITETIGIEKELVGTSTTGKQLTRIILEIIFLHGDKCLDIESFCLISHKRNYGSNPTNPIVKMNAKFGQMLL